ncbi:PIR Superfamily Protein [Plasmodium ovale wallikeri]|uniref:PIR Superfamily Protein n=2 Tax=Plasmodium ovale TaxID=36330 RepID=A0A1A9ADI0_PLAOA|nr:PIR Superfamily Protein [Plasmodium ovale wallikeri]SBT56169.1 PIR Superfamily Protein [Plasmodium ovale wallikeri]SBT73100.1 PIR protein [Plasmodium ovale]
MPSISDEQLDVILKGLPSYQIYEELDKDVDNISDFSNVCKDVNSFENQYKGISKLCAKIAKNFGNYTKIKSMITSDDDSETYLTHWIYSAIRKFFITNFKNIPGILPQKLLDVANNSYQKSYRSYIITEYSHNFDETKEEKDLFDYFVNYDKFTSNIKNDNNKCDKYCEYITYIKSLNERHRYLDGYDCCPFYNCYDYLKCDEKYDPGNLLSMLKEEAKEPAKHAKVAVPPVANEQQDFSTSYKHERQTSEGSTNPGHTHQDVSTQEIRNHEVSSSKVEIPFVPRMLENLDQVSHNNLENLNYDLKKYLFRITASFILIIGLLYLFSLYFKLDRLGTRFSKKIRRKNKFRYPVNDELNDQLTLNDSQCFYINTINGGLRIAYNPHRENYELA